jgi:hypothetical protein
MTESTDAEDDTRDPGSAKRGAILSYRDIEAYRRAMGLLAPLHVLLGRLPDIERFELASQLRRREIGVGQHR